MIQNNLFKPIFLIYPFLTTLSLEFHTTLALVRPPIQPAPETFVYFHVSLTCFVVTVLHPGKVHPTSKLFQYKPQH